MTQARNRAQKAAAPKESPNQKPVKVSADFKPGRKKLNLDVEPTVIIRESQKVKTHTFKLVVEKMLKNTAFHPGLVHPNWIEHCHIFHSVNSQGKPQEKSSKTGGHYHEISWWVEKDGSLRAECGPPLCKKARRVKNKGTIYETKPVQFWDEENEKWIVDNHTHDIRYLHSNELSMQKAQKYHPSPEEIRIARDKAVLREKGEASINV